MNNNTAQIPVKIVFTTKYTGFRTNILLQFTESNGSTRSNALKSFFVASQ